MAKIWDLLLILCVLFFVIFKLGAIYSGPKNFHDGALRGYMVGYDSFYEKAFFSVKDSLDRCLNR